MTSSRSELASVSRTRASSEGPLAGAGRSDGTHHARPTSWFRRPANQSKAMIASTNGVMVR